MSYEANPESLLFQSRLWWEKTCLCQHCKATRLCAFCWRNLTRSYGIGRRMAWHTHRHGAPVRTITKSNSSKAAQEHRERRSAAAVQAWQGQEQTGQQTTEWCPRPVRPRLGLAGGTSGQERRVAGHAAASSSGDWTNPWSSNPGLPYQMGTQGTATSKRVSFEELPDGHPGDSHQ
jgi:hypothetical protein